MSGLLGVGIMTAPADDSVNIVSPPGIPVGWPPGPWDGPGPDRNYSIKSTLLESPEKFVGNDFGRSMLAFDFDEDGFDNLLVMERGACANGMCSSGWGWVFFGPSFAESVKFQAEHPVEGEYLGWHQGSVGDVDGDGVHDLLIPSSRYDSPGRYTDVGRAHVFLGPDFTRDLVLDDPTPQDDGNGLLHPSPEASSFEAGNTYVGVLSTSGSEPGAIPAPGVYVPLNPDATTQAGLALLESPILPDFVGVLDEQGVAVFQLVLPPGPAESLVGEALTVAVVTIRADGRLSMGSNAVDIEITP